MKTLPLFVTQLKSFGFRVFVKNQGEIIYAFYSKDNKIGYVQEGGWGVKYSFSTVHHENRYTGTGYGIIGEAMTKENAEKAFAFAPDWASTRDLPSIVKYRDVEHFLKRKGNLIEV